MTHKLGIDTGGTHTDVALLDDRDRVVAHAKAATTHDDFSRGIAQAIAAVRAQAPDAAIGLVALATTLATNALIEARHDPVGLILIGLDAGALSRGGLGAALADDPVAYIAGGHRASGAELQPLDRAALADAVAAMAQQVSAFAVAGLFATRNPAHERAAAELIHAHTGKPVCAGHTLADDLDAPKRALTALLNARLLRPGARLLAAVRVKLTEFAIHAPLVVVRGDGALLTADQAERQPIETIASGAAASVIGAKHLGGVDEAVIADIGGTTTDFARLDAGRVALDPLGARIGGMRCAVRAARVTSVGLGGDSAVWRDASAAWRIGPMRAVPLCALAAEHAELLDTLRGQWRREAARAEDGQFALRREGAGDAPLSAPQQRVLDALAHGPQSLHSLVAEQRLGLPLERLRARGAVALATVTVSDAARALDRLTTGSREASVLGLALLARLWRLAAPEDDMLRAATDLAERVLDRFTQESARALMACVLREQGDWPDRPDEQPAAHALLDAALRADDHAALRLDAGLNRPLVAIGAAASCHYPAIARALNAELVLPSYAEVAGAVGAAVGGVLARARVLVTAQDERFRVHVTPALILPEEGEAIAAAEQRARDLAAEAARAAGLTAWRIEVSHSIEAVESYGERVFVQGHIEAVASGRPDVSALAARQAE